MIALDIAALGVSSIALAVSIYTLAQLRRRDAETRHGGRFDPAAAGTAGQEIADFWRAAEAGEATVLRYGKALVVSARPAVVADLSERKRRIVRLGGRLALRAGVARSVEI